MSKNSLKRQNYIRAKSCLNWVLLGKVMALTNQSFMWPNTLQKYLCCCLLFYIFVIWANCKIFHNTTILNHSKNYNRKSRTVTWKYQLFCSIVMFSHFLRELFPFVKKKQMKTLNTLLTPTCLKLGKPGKRNIVCYRW